MSDSEPLCVFLSRSSFTAPCVRNLLALSPPLVQFIQISKDIMPRCAKLSGNRSLGINLLVRTYHYHTVAFTWHKPGRLLVTTKTQF